VTSLSSIFDPDRAVLFALVLARCGGLIATAPVFGEALVPRTVRVLLAGALAIVLLPLAPSVPKTMTGLPDLVMAALVEVALGLAMGYTARLTLLVFEMAGEAVSLQMGLGIASMVDPMETFRTTILGRWYWIVGMTLFLSLDGHHYVLRALAASMQAVPPGRGVLGGNAVAALSSFAADALGRALAIGAPAIGVLLATTLGLGLLARTVPQMNVFLVSYPIQIAAGILAVTASTPFLVDVGRHEVGDLVTRLSILLRAF
jgi:flagellar biosynthesis protein FliR